MTPEYKTFNKTYTLKSVSWIGTSQGLKKTSSNIFYWQKKCTDLICPTVYYLPDTKNDSKHKKIIHLPNRWEAISSCSYPHTDVTILLKNLIYDKTHSIHCYTPTCFRPQGVILREYWHILRAESTKYMSRCKHMIDEQQSVCFAARGVAMCHKTYNMLLFNLIFTSGQVFC